MEKRIWVLRLKKAYAIVLEAVFCLGVLAGCGSGSKDVKIPDMPVSEQQQATQQLTPEQKQLLEQGLKTLRPPTQPPAATNK
ncbi:MAG TPA: hypothetical protein PKY35_04385 [Candidatus Hydrogenedentes bacterium]|nr:hypothetical protein [Candidatus Hydrogenedentota bacterium]HOL76245.1 hypothetical protein [Candidatus Hydrogenedentota bacterium]HPO86784.1 hypothetical protein [Candidatus Hydrogenedentota bacterium]